MNSRRSLFFNVDWFVILIYLALCAIGWFNIHAAVFDASKPSMFDMSTNYGKQTIFIITAIIIGIVILLLDSKFFSTFSPVFYGITLLLLVVVLIVGRNVGGNQAWIPIGNSFRLQPSEFAKFATSLLLAHYIGTNNLRLTDRKTIGFCLLIILLPAALIMLQPDTGSAITFSSLVLALYREGLSVYVLIIAAAMIVLFVLSLMYNQLLIIGIIVVLGALFIALSRKTRKLVINTSVTVLASALFTLSVHFAYDNILQKHQRNRIDVILGKIDDPRGQGYNLNQSMIAIGSGGLWGKGYLQGTQTKYDFVPEQSTDFIFCTVGEEWGFAGSFVVVALYVFLILRVVQIAERQRSTFSRVYGYCVASVFFFHVLINIGMTIGLVPVIGIPLPFLSYGGSSLWSFTILLFILLKLDSNRMGII